MEISHQDWVLTGHLSHSLRRAGLTLPLVDCVLAHLATKHEASILSLDDDFLQIAKHIPLRLHPLPGDYPRGPERPHSPRAAEPRKTYASRSRRPKKTDPAVKLASRSS